MIIALAQINPTVADLRGNRDKIIAGIETALRAGADVVAFPELAVMGYPPHDLLLHAGFIADAARAIEQIARACGPDITAMVGFAEHNPESAGRPLFNSVACCRDGRVVAVHHKLLLPTYDVFDESRYFEPGRTCETAVLPLRDGGSVRAGLCICEDLWNDADFVSRPLYHTDPMQAFAQAQVDIVLNVSASPYVVEKQAYRERLFGGQAAKHRVPIVVVNQVGGNDELVFDGASSAFDAQGRLIGRAKAFEEDVLAVELPPPRGAKGRVASSRVEPYPDALGSILGALTLGTRDYVRKCGFREVLLGLSGGIDSAVTAAIAVEALGCEAVRGVALPSRFSSDHSREDARALAANLRIRFDEVSIDEMHRAAERTLAPLFAGRAPDITEENIQARIRGNLLMALSNKLGCLLLTTGNKSELAVGYCTLYGDMCGGLALLSDVPKTMVYELGRYINRRAGQAVIPQRTFEKPPSAELRPDQTDQDSLPAYAVLDAILHRYIELEQSPEEIVAAGCDAAVTAEVIRLVDRNEYKRRQAAPGPKVTTRAFGIGRRMPIARGAGRL